jgi:hypothetical protein
MLLSMLVSSNFINIIFTTPLNSFTDGIIPSVTGMNSVGNYFTDGIIDGPSPSV